MLDRMPAFLTWARDEDAGGDVFASYLRLLTKRLGELAAHTRRNEPSLYEALVAELEAASDAALVTVLCRPVTSRRLLVLHAPVAAETAAALVAGLREQARREATPPAAGSVSDLTVEYDSDHALRVDLDGELLERERPREPPGPDWISGVDARLRLAVDRIGDVNERVRTFVTTFNRVVVAQPNADAPGRFSSGSTRRFIGRSALGNPDCVSLATLASALIHEGIHALLYMQSVESEWVAGDIDPHARVESPWTGASLEVEPFLQACFVWYGLLHFWALAAPRDVFPHHEVDATMRECARGFFAGPLTNLVRNVRSAIAPDVLATIDDLQARVAGAAAATERVRPSRARSVR
jgi:hypothetical protein